jgi:hypothetical protein
MRSMMPAQPKQTIVRRFASALRLAGVLLVLSGNLAAAQDVPIVSGALGFFDSKNTGVNFFQPVAAPVVVAPLGKHFLAEARFDLRGVYIPQNGTSGPYQGSFVGTTQYLQLDYLASRRITFTAGRFLTPFGTYNERLSAIWIAKLQDGPLIFPIGTRTTGSSNGVMVRGALFANPTIHVNYIGYFSASSNATQFQAGRAAGYRFDFYFPSKRVELGTSYGRFLQGTHNNSTGFHFWWQPWRFPLEVRSEYAHGAHAQGYWIENAYRLSQWKGPDSLFGRLEPVFRLQQTFRNSPGPGDGLPAANTTQVDFGLDYHLPHEVRLNGSYSRKLSAAGNGNIWDISLTYRFLFPMWRGHQ